LISLVTATTAKSLAFLIHRYLARTKVRPLLEERRIVSAIDDAVAEEGCEIVALVRLNHLVPSNLQKYLFGVTAISFRHFGAMTSAGIFPGTVLYIYLGALGKATASSGTAADTLTWAFFGNMGVLRRRAARDPGRCRSCDPKGRNKAQGIWSRRSKPMMCLSSFSQGEFHRTSHTTSGAARHRAGAAQESIFPPKAPPNPTNKAAVPRFHIRIITEASRS
jgi:hypothetical protein